MLYRSVGERGPVTVLLRTFCGLGRRNGANFTGTLAQQLNGSGATPIDVCAADAVEAIAVEVFRHCECSGSRSAWR
jgi:hypothetical protein